MKNLKSIIQLLTPSEKRRGATLLLLILVMAIFDMIGVASIMPFMAVLANPEIIQNNLFLESIYTHLQFGNKEQFLFFLGTVVLILLVLSLIVKALTTYIQVRFIYMLEYSIGRRLLEGYLHQQYSWFLTRHSAELGKVILSEVKEVIDKAVAPMMALIAQGTVTMALVLLLVFTDPTLAFATIVTLASAYALIFKVTKNVLLQKGKERFKANQERFTAISDAFGTPKELKVRGLEQAFVKRFNIPAKRYAYYQSTAQVISQLPRFALEAVAFGGLLLVILYQMAKNGNFVTALPVIALYAFAGYRLMPALQQIYGAVTQMRFVRPALSALNEDLCQLQTWDPLSIEGQISLTDKIQLKGVHYYFPASKAAALKNMNLTISAKSTVGIVGTTGSGKTTTVDLILALLQAQEGTLEVDGQVITSRNAQAWQRNIGYVSQQIYLSDDTIAANIAFGIELQEVDQAAVELAAKTANLHDFIINDLPEQYSTRVGERGVRLSGGQRQRIGIARALYNKPQILILDEATSALDNLTEKAVMDAVHQLSHEITIIIIAHRLSTVKECDKIFFLEKGAVKSEGTFNELVTSNKQFKEMARLV